MNKNTIYTGVEGLKTKIKEEQEALLLDLKIKEFLSDPSKNIYLKQKKKTVLIQIFDENSIPINEPKNLDECVDFFKVSLRTITRKLVSGKHLLFDNKKFTIKRIPKKD